MTDRTLDEAIEEIISTVSDDVAALMKRVIQRERNDRFNPQDKTPQDYARMAWEIKYPDASGGA